MYFSYIFHIIESLLFVQSNSTIPYFLEVRVVVYPKTRERERVYYSL